jgi:hypothetical protein
MANRFGRFKNWCKSTKGKVNAGGDLDAGFAGRYDSNNDK